MQWMIETPADLIMFNGNFVTLNPRRARDSAMALHDGRIAAVGTDNEILQYANQKAPRIDLRGRTVTPGFCDAHIHLFLYGQQRMRDADLVGAQSIEELLERLSVVAARSEGWIQGHGFDQEKMSEKRFPKRKDLDRLSSKRPIIVSRICGHAVVVNSAALALLSSEEAAAGDADSGLYTEGTSDAFYRRIPEATEIEGEHAVEAAQKIALQTGITSIQTLLDAPEQMGAYSRLRRKGKLLLRVMGTPPWSSIHALYQHGINTGFGDQHLRFGALKLFSDGSLGARTAWMAEPFADDPLTRGIRIYEPEILKQKCREAQQKGFQIAIHAIGDQALRETLDAIEFALNGESNQIHRHRVEHASVCPPDCLERMAKHKIIAVLQPQFITSDTWTGERLGKVRRVWAYPFKQMIEAGVPVALSSDCPVERLDAFAAIAATVGRSPWSPEGGLTVEQAIHAYCMGSAYAGFAENWSGSLEAGKVADFVVLSEDITQLPPERITQVKAEQVWIDGKKAG
ncbi:MAG TPA: amidohydrolase [Tepidisphaeraceae bacterium]|jgi:hypothetical protein